VTLLLLFAAVALGWCVQLLLTYRQSKAFTSWIRALRAKGTVSVGKGGRRYRGGVAFVAIAVDDDRGVVAEAMALRGFTTFARPDVVPCLRGVRVSVLAGTRDIAELRANEREAVRQAATLYRDRGVEVDLTDVGPKAAVAARMRPHTDKTPAAG